MHALEKANELYEGLVKNMEADLDLEREKTRSEKLRVEAAAQEARRARIALVSSEDRAVRQERMIKEQNK